MLPEIAVYPTAELPHDVALQALSFMRVVWTEGFIGKNRYRDWITEDEYHPVSFVIVDHGLLVSFAQVLWRWIDHAGETFKMYGLSGVFTYPAFRREGHGRRIVDACTAYIETQDPDIGLFYCEPYNKTFYERSGWEHIAAGVTLIGDPKAPQVFDAEIMMMRFFTEKGKSARSKFEQIPLYWGDYPW